MLTFDEAKHEYRWRGVLVPNVTRIIAPMTDYSLIQPDVLERARQEGTAIHKMVELDCKSDLDVENLPDWLRPRYEAWCCFKHETGFECISFEQRMYHDALGYAGTADLFCLLNKLPTLKGVNNIDIKRSLYGGPAIGLQTAAYSELWNRASKANRALHVKHRSALILNANGTYRLKPYDDPEDRIAFFACLQQWRWRYKHYPEEKRNGCS